ncbi:MAG TPA: M23 family metallopeptidase [Syntrophales bacterium]|jgi:murein DD-endopeptidase MepM/ murein hydrolase activator NlpD|nr:M23 family metallopeptidase [Syntrophales bacterium]
MAKRGFTLLIIPRKDGPVHTFGIPGSLLKRLAAVLAVVILASLYFAYDYISVRRDAAELARLRAVTGNQEKQIVELAGRLERYSARMNELSEFDRKIRIAANIEGSRDKQVILGIGGAVPEEGPVPSRLDGDRQAILTQVVQGVDRLEQEAAAREKSFVQILHFLNRQRSVVAATPSLWPVRGLVTSEFGTRSSPFGGGREYHEGIDVATQHGTPVRAPADGVVLEASMQSGYGNVVKLDHGRGLSTLYGHLSRIAVRKGTIVRRGEVIGYVGNTGRSTGSHLHYSVYFSGVAVNPRNYLRR